MATQQPSLNGAEKIQSTALEYILQAKDQLDDFLENVSEAASDMRDDVVQFEYLFDSNSTPLPSFKPKDIANAPSAPNISLSIPGLSASLEQDTVPTLNTGTEPAPFTKSAPGIGTYNFPDPLEAFTGIEPTINLPGDIVLTDPDAIAAPVVSETAVPDIPLPTIPSFVEDVEFTIDAPVIPQFSHAEQIYTSELLENTSTKLMYDMLNGGYGIEPADEQALWGRAYDRESRLMDAKVRDVANETAAKGFVAPAASYYQRVNDVRRAFAEKMSDLSRDIAVKRADLFVENRKFTIQESQKLEGLLSTIYGAHMERALKAQVSSIEMAAAVYSIKASELNARISLIKTKADVYETQLKSVMAPIEVAKARLEGAKLQSSIKRDTIDIYKARVDAASQFVQMQRARLEAYISKLQAEKTKLELYKLRVEAYSARAQAKSVELQAYKARIEGDVAQLQGFESEVKAHASLVDVYKTRVQAKVAEVDAVVKSNQGKVQAFEGRVTAYKAGVDAQTTAARTQLELYKTNVDAWAKKADAEIQTREQEYDLLKHERQIVIERANAKMQTAIEKYRELRETNSILMKYNDSVSKT